YVFSDTAAAQIYTPSLHDALPISQLLAGGRVDQAAHDQVDGPAGALRPDLPLGGGLGHACASVSRSNPTKRYGRWSWCPRNCMEAWSNHSANVGSSSPLRCLSNSSIPSGLLATSGSGSTSFSRAAFMAFSFGLFRHHTAQVSAMSVIPPLPFASSFPPGRSSLSPLRMWCTRATWTS